jgi:hypothetical protein
VIPFDGMLRGSTKSKNLLIARAKLVRVAMQEKLDAKEACHARSVFVATFSVLSKTTLALQQSNKYSH